MKLIESNCTLLRLTATVLLGMLLLLLPGCARDDAPQITGNGKVQLMLRVVVNQSAYSGEDSHMSSVVKKAQSTEDQLNYFEPPVLKWEGVNTLRVIIVRTELGIVEHNRLISIEESQQLEPMIEQQTFSVEGDERKTIYFIANEESLDQESRTMLSSMNPEMEANADALMGLIIKTAPGQPVIIDNEVSDESKRFVPMSEVFVTDIVKADEKKTQTSQAEMYFITRSCVKYSFTIDPGSYLNMMPPDPETLPKNPETQESEVKPQDPKSFRITKITISDIADRQYLFPNNTEYSPAKYDGNGKVSGDNRYITSYNCPSGTQVSEYTFSPENFGLNYSENTAYTSTYSPQIYFPESPEATNGYRISIEAQKEGNARPVTFNAVVLPNLPLLPRNTHVKVKLKFTPYSLDCKVEILPYSEVTLDPEFGLGKIS